MFSMNSGLSSAIIPVHPTKLSVHLFEILQGRYAYVKGQTLHSSLRNPGVFSRQLFIHIYKTVLSSCTYDHVISDWQKYEDNIKSRWKNEDFSSDSFRKSTYQSWAQTMKMTIDQLVMNNIYQIIHTKTTSYERYTDWVMALGMVPVVKQEPDKKLIEKIQTHFFAADKIARSNGRVMQIILSALEYTVTDILETLTSIYIPDYSEVTIDYISKDQSFVGTYKGNHISVEVISKPIMAQNIFFDSPVQRLFQNIMSCYRTTEHAKLCQLLNTAPIKAICGTATQNTYKDILSHLEQNSQKSDPKRELLNLLIKLAENKTVSGVTDVVEEFITDVSQNIVDKNKLFGSQESTTQGLKKHVSNNVFKCLTSQINEQFDTINKLEKERELCLGKINQIETQLLQLTQDEKQNLSPDNVLVSDTFYSLQTIQESKLSMTSSSIPKGAAVLNSFFSQYVPPFRELNKDLTLLWESEIFHTFKLTPVVDPQGQRLYVKYTQDTITILVGPFTYAITKLYQMELINDIFVSMSFSDIAAYIYSASRLAVYIADIGNKYCPSESDGSSSQNITRS
ncbi:orf 43 [Ateline gammaherpesvirus 3]|uniref:Orf 43 n=1 Tax=Ateline herpesvirus 3 TaxID=85618 RepID=Q9YTM2_ATHV3|nr:orf 43 [Ateline gammaherpesvirus 3]AAC95575.1 orf 43 [Ateline gammaherpesvirus 3]